MKKFAAVSVLGKNKPGIVAAVTKVLFETGCNIEDSSMTMLANEFAMILMIALPPKLTLPKLSAKFSSLSRTTGLSVSLKPLKASEETKPRAKGAPYIISVYGSDKPGIVYGISKYLASEKINITDVQTNISSVAGKHTYVMFLEVDLPAGIAYEKLKNELLKVADSLGVSVSMNAVDTANL